MRHVVRWLLLTVAIAAGTVVTLTVAGVLVLLAGGGGHP